MARVSIGNYEFEVNPSTFSWGYALNTKSYETYGGRVVQILSCRVNDCTVQGYLPVSKDPENAYAEMERFESRMLALMDWQAQNKKPLLFRFPLLGWEGTVYITQYGPVSYSYDMAAVTYTLQLSVDDGFEEISHSITDEAQLSIESIPNGVNWVRSRYNTPIASTWETSLEVIREILENSGNYQSVGLRDYYEMLQQKIAEKNSNGALSITGVAEDSFWELAANAVSYGNAVGGILNAIGNARESGMNAISDSNINGVY